MAYGMQIYDSSGDLVFDYNDRIARVVFKLAVGASDSGSVMLSDVYTDGTPTIKTFSVVQDAGITYSDDYKSPHIVSSTRYGINILIEWEPNSVGAAAWPAGGSYIYAIAY